MLTIAISFGVSGLLAGLIGLALGFFKERFVVDADSRASEARALLPGGDCGSCGFPGCDSFAKALVSGQSSPEGCPPGGSEAALALGEFLKDPNRATDNVALLLCMGGKTCVDRGEYSGGESCAAIGFSIGSIKRCAWACQGFGDCVPSCKQGAIAMGPDGLPKIDYEKCVGCGSCSEACPKGLFILVPRKRRGAIVLCQNRSGIKGQVAKSCKLGCVKCGLCVNACPQACISMRDGIPSVNYAHCTSCGVCVSQCPSKIFKLVERVLS